MSERDAILEECALLTDKAAIELSAESNEHLRHAKTEEMYRVNTALHYVWRLGREIRALKAQP